MAIHILSRVKPTSLSSSKRNPQSAGSILASSFCHAHANNGEVEDPYADNEVNTGAVQMIYLPHLKLEINKGNQKKVGKVQRHEV